MPITEVNLPSGRVMKVNHPEGAATEDILAFAKSEYDSTLDNDNLLIDAAKTVLAGGVQAAINTGAGVAQTYSMLLGPESDESEEAIQSYVARQAPGSRMTAGKVRAHRKAKNKAIAKVNENAHRMRQMANSVDDKLGVDQDFAESLPGQIARGFGQVPVTLAAGVGGTLLGGPVGGVSAVIATAAPQMMTEAINDAEQTLGKDYGDMDQEEKNQVALSSVGYMTLGTALETAGFLKTVPGLKRFILGKGKLTSGTLKSLKREVAEGLAAEGFTESTQGQLLDAFAKATYDDDRALMSMETLGRRFNEFIVGGVVGGATAGGAGVFERAATGRLFQPKTEDQAPDPDQPPVDVGDRGEIPLDLKQFKVTYTDKLTGQEMTQRFEALDADQADTLFNDALGDVYDPDIGITIEEERKSEGADLEEPEEDVAVAPTPELDLTPDEIDIINQELANETDPIGQAGDRIPNILDEEDITAKAFTPYKEEMMPRPEVVEAALPIFRKLKSGERITVEESKNLASVVDRVNPVRPYKDVPPPASEADMRRALDKGKLSKINKGRDIETGTFVKLRLDIPAYRDKGVWVPTIHEATAKTKGFRGGASISHQSTSVVTNARFGVIGYEKPTGQALAAGIAAKEETKIPVATILGEYANISEDQAVARAEAAINDPSFIQVGMDPKRRGYFYNRETMQEVLSADEVIQVGPLVLAKNPVYGKTPRNEFLSREVEGAVEQDVVAEAGKQTVSYDLLDSSYINDYDGKEAEDKTLPDYDSLHYLVSEPNRQAINKAIESGAVDQLANDIAEEASEMMEDPQIAAGIGWYSRMRVRLKEIFGTDTELFTHLLGTTSAQTAVELNFRYSVDLYNRFKAGEFDSKIKKYLELRGRMQAGTLGDLLIRIGATNSKGVKYTKDLVKKSQPSALLQSAARHYDLLPKQKSGDLYGANSYPALKALSEVWFEDRIGPNRMTPKTPQFAMNLNGQSMEATIDLWAARLLHRKIHGGQTRILPSEETAVENGDFALGQIVFRRAGKKLNMNPDDLQALVWFGEKQIWDQNGWTGAAGALKSSFDEPAAVFYPETGTRSEEDANLILDFIAAERLVKRDIDFPDAVKPATQANNRKAYDEYLRSSVISDYIKSTGRRTVYEGRSVESDRKRQVTRSINRLRGYGGSVSYRKGQGKEPTRSLKVVKRSDYLDSTEGKTASEVFSETAARNKKANRFGSSVDVLKAADYNNHDIIVTSSKKGQYATLSISPDGEITSVTKSKGATRLDVSAAFDMAISTGKVKYLNGFETILPDIYANYGFTPVARLKFDPQFQPPGWSYSTYREFNKGKPDVIFMRFDGTMGSVYDPTGFPEVQSYEDGIEAARAEVTAPADVTAQNLLGDRTIESPEGGFPSIKAMEDFIRDNFKAIASKIGVNIEPNYAIFGQAQYNVTQGVIQYNPRNLFTARTQEGIRAAMREEIIHAAMHKVLMQRSPSKSRNDAWLDFMGKLGKDLTQEQRDAIASVYSNLTRDDQFGAEYSRAAIQYLLYGDVTEQYVVGGKAWDTIKKLFRSVQTYLARVLGKDIDQNPEAAAVIRDSVALVEKSDPQAKITNQRISKKAEKIADRNDGTGDVDTEVVVNAAQPPSKKKDLSAFDKYIFTATSVMNRISPELSRLFKQFFFRVDKQTLDHMKRVQPFVKKYNAIKNKKDKLRLKQLLYYSPDIDPRAEERQQRVAERTALLRKYGMLNDYNLRVRPVLDILRTRANQEGMEVPYLNDYFPRKVVDLDKIREYYGEVVVKDFSSYIERINEQRAKEVDPSKRKPPIERGSNEEALEFDKYIRSGEFTKRGIKPRNTQQRTIEFVDEEIADAYADPGEALESYIQGMVMATETMRLLGRRYEVEGENVKFERGSELSQTIQRLLAEGKINDEQAFRTIPQFSRIILNPVMKEVGLLSGVRSFSYFTLLVEPTTTLSQLFDLPFQMYDKGFFPVLSAALGKKTFRLSDVGIDNQQVSAEFKNERKWLDDAVRLGLRATGFSRLDQLMKETGMQANYNRYRKLAREYKKNRDSNQSKKFKTELEFIMGNDADAAIAALNKGDRNNDLVRELIRSKLLETQPISRMEMPLIVSQNANARSLYTMKSFMVTQLNFVVNKMLSQMFGPNRTKQQRLKGASDLAKLMFFMVMIGMPVDALKDLLAGRLGYLSDYLFNGIFRVAGISRYQTYVARKEGIGQAAFDYVTPVGIQQAVDISAELQRVATGQKAITDSKLVTLAPFSDVINRVFGFSREREEREYERRAREGVLPTFIPPGALY